MTNAQQHGFGEYLDGRITGSGLSQRDVARKAGISEGTVRAYIRGSIDRGGVSTPVVPTLRTVVKIADALEVDRAEMLAAAGIEAPPHLLAGQPRKGEPSNAELLELLERRLQVQTAPVSPPRFNPAQKMTNDEVLRRGKVVAALRKVAADAEASNDQAAAEAVNELIAEMREHLRLVNAADISEARTDLSGQ